MHRRSFIKKAGAAGLIVWATPGGIWNSSDAENIDALETRFRNPLHDDHPHVMWFWMNGNISREGITADLEAMHRVGIKGVLHFDAGISIPEGPVAYGSPAWISLKLHAMQEAKRLGISYAMHNCPGWSSSGGPWITPELSMKQLTWSELYVSGGGNLHTTLPLPFHKMEYYRDVAVLAYPSLPGEIFLQQYTVHTPAGQVPKESVTGQQGDGAPVFPAGSEDAWLLFRFATPAEVRFISFIITATEGSAYPVPEGRTSVVLEASDDGIRFRRLATISTGLEAELKEGDKWITYDIEPARAKYFRLRSAQPRCYRQVRFSGIIRLEKFLEKTGNRFQFSGADTSPIYSGTEKDVAAADTIAADSILDISAFMNEKGTLQWQAPPGAWTLLRFGYTTTGSTNKAAPGSGTGLECDKFSPDAIHFHFHSMMALLQPAIEKLGTAQLALEIDSYEAGPQTWTENFGMEFKKRRGYQITSWLAATTGRVLDNRNQTEQFLWDLRRTQADLMAEHYYGKFTELCHEKGYASFVQPYDKGPFEEMQVGAKADVAMGEMWYGLSSLLQGNAAVRRTARLAASIMNNKGERTVAAESFTSEPESSRWQEYPFSLKVVGDKMFCEGINKILIHRFVHQPHAHAAPGMTMGPWGIHFDRTNTWFEEAGGWLQYLARCQAMLQQGWPVKDLVYFTGEESNIYTRVNRDELTPAPPHGFDWGLVDAATILQKLSIVNGQIVLPHGMRYRVMVLQDYKGITWPLLEKLRHLVAAGMILVGKKPQQLLGLQHAPQQETFAAIADALWKDAAENGSCDILYGKGRVLWNPSMEEVLRLLQIEADFSATAQSGEPPLLFVHRRMAGVEIYFVCNQRRTSEEVVCAFRVAGREPEIWDPATGIVQRAPFYDQLQTHVHVPLQLEPYGSRFVVFRAAPSGTAFSSLRQNGKLIWKAKPFSAPPEKMVPQIGQNFSIVFWAKPEMNIMLRPSVHMGNVPHAYTDYYALYPASALHEYGAGHATCGIAVGRNGIAVWENEVIPEMVLAATVPVSGWSHIGVVYEKGSPSVYLDGKKVGEGKKSKWTIHPSSGDVSMEEAGSFYNGDLEGLQVFDRILRDDELQSMARKFLLPSPQNGKQASFSYFQKNSLLFWQPGDYEMQGQGGKKISFNIPGIDAPVPLTHNWRLEFPSKKGAPTSFLLPHLVSLHRLEDPGIKYFSGTVAYKNEFHIAKEHRSKNKRLFLDLGRVEVMARVIVNEKDLGLLWQRPYRTDITSVVKTGINMLEIRVTNLWPNRLIGDEQFPEPHLFSDAGSSGFEHLAGAGFEKTIGLAIKELPGWYLEGKQKPEDGRVAFTTWKHYQKNDPLLESGLLGPVQIVTAVVRNI